MKSTVHLIGTKMSGDFKSYLSQNIYFIRGIAIVLVVIGHVLGGIKETYGSDIFGLIYLHSFIYTFHMPIFFIASGIAFAAFSNQSITWAEFLQSKLKRLLIPLVCWTPVYFIFRQSLSKPNQITILNIIKAIVNSYGIFWFIHALLFATCLSFICLKVFKSKSIYILLSIIIFALSLYLENRIIYYNIFYAFGILLAIYLEKIHSTIEKSPLKLLYPTLALSVAVMLLTNNFLVNNQGFVSRYLVTFINGMIAFLSLYTTIILVETKHVLVPRILYLTKPNFIFLGKISMIIYLFHMYFITVTKIFVSRLFTTTAPSLYFILGSFIGVLGSILIYKLFYKKSKIFRYSLGEGK